MSQLTDRGPTLSSRGRASTQRSAALGTAFLGGVLAAGLGLGAFAVAVLLLWVASPYPDSDPSRALHLVADLWFLAHGSDLVRVVTLSGDPSPVAVTPLLLTALPVWLLYRSARHILECPVSGDTGTGAGRGAGPKTDAGPTPAYPTRAPAPAPAPDPNPDPNPSSHPHPDLDPDLDLDPHPEPDHAAPRGPEEPPPPAGPGLLHPDDVDPEPGPRLLLGWVLAGYLLVAAAALLYASAGPLHVEPLSALLYLPLAAAVTLAVAAWHAVGRDAFVPLPGPVQRVREGLPPGLRAALEGPRLAAALRAGTAGLLALLLCGALLVLLALGWHAPAVRAEFLALAPDWAGRCTVLLLSLVLLPNAVVWGLAYGLGPGFTLGAGSTAGPLGAAGYPALPHFPLFGMVPEAGGAGALHWLTAAVPLAAGVALARYATLTTKAYAAATRPAADGASPPQAAAAKSWDTAVAAGWTGWRETAAAAGLGALACGAVSAVLAGLAGGALGNSALSHFGPGWWQTGAAATGWTALVGVPGALVVRAWWLRGAPRPPKPAPRPRVKLRTRLGRAVRWLAKAALGAGRLAWAAARFCGRALGRTAARRLRRTPACLEPYDYAYAYASDGDYARDYGCAYEDGAGADPRAQLPWHDTSTRRARWSALRASSGGLMAEFEPALPREPEADLPYEEPATAPAATSGNASAAGPEGGG
ncbi:DUF6350 family protein [Streptomyces sp. NPDC007100]|uniref:cell division protein PerM n=1 Tax=Streptomyces sp. NPDC007100 TaxID=3155602 RepID=UPI0033D04AAE